MNDLSLRYQIYPVQAVPSQTLNILPNGQSVTLYIYQKSTGLFMDVFLSGALLIAGIRCAYNTYCIRETYWGLVGDFVWLDMQGTSDPYYTSLGSRFLLCYVIPTTQVSS